MIALRGRAIFASGLLVLAHAATAEAQTDAIAADTRCLSPEAGQLLNEQVQAHALDRDLPAGYRVDHVSVRSSSIEIGVVDDHGLTRAVTLRFRLPDDVHPDGRGASFAFFIEGGAPDDPVARAALLRVAAIADAALPEAALHGCRSDVDARSWIEEGAPAPRFVALFVGLFEVLIVLAALAIARRKSARVAEAAWRTRAEGMGNATTLTPAAQLTIFAAALFAFHRQAGSSPITWLDTAHDESSVQACLTQGACTRLGQATSVQGLYHAVGWLDFRTLLAWMGLELSHVHLALQGLSALAVVLVAGAAARVGGRAAALAASVAFATLAFGTPMFDAQALYNTVPLFFLGAVFLVVCTEAWERPDAASIVAASLLAAVLASVHAGCVLACVSVVAIALRAPIGRMRLAMLTVTTFAVAIVAIGPGTWAHNFMHVLAVLGGAHTSGPRAAGVSTTLVAYGGQCVLALAAGWLVRLRAGERSRAVEAAVAIAVPMLAVSALTGASSAVHMNSKYLTHAGAAGAILFATPIAVLAPRIDAYLRTRSAWALRAARALPFAAAIAIAVWGLDRHGYAASTITFGDLARVAHVLREDRGWSWSHVYRSLKSPEDAVLLECLDVISPSWPIGPTSDDPTTVHVLRVAADRVPTALPDAWVIVNREGDRATLLVFVRTALDWRDFQACASRGQDDDVACVETGLALEERPSCAYCVPGMPSSASAIDGQTLTLHIPVVEAPAGETREIEMVERRGICTGTIVRVPGSEAHITDDGRRASWSGSGIGGARPEVWLQWQLGSDHCARDAYTGFPPYFIEADGETVGALDALDAFHQ